jgi:hypothetical protein
VEDLYYLHKDIDISQPKLTFLALILQNPEST